MIQVYNSKNQKIWECKNYDDLLRHITRLENAKIFKDHPDYGQKIWSFTIYRPKMAEIVYRELKRYNEHYNTYLMKEAIEKELPLIEMFNRGEDESFSQILVTPDVDVEAVKRKWCHEYCEGHKLKISE